MKPRSHELLQATSSPRKDPSARSVERQLAQLEQLRKLRRDRAQGIVRQAVDDAAWAERLTQGEADHARSCHARYLDAQVEVGHAVDGGGTSLEEVRRLIEQADRARRVTAEARASADLSFRQQLEAEQRAEAARREARQASAAYEKVVEWKK